MMPWENLGTIIRGQPLFFSVSLTSLWHIFSRNGNELMMHWDIHSKCLWTVMKREVKIV
jgi:hypothetical protein